MGDVGGRAATEVLPRNSRSFSERPGSPRRSVRANRPGRRRPGRFRTGCATAPRSSAARLRPSAIAVFIGQLAIKAGIFQRDRGLRGQQFQHGDPVRRENVRGQVVFEIEHAHQLGLFDQRQTENRSGVLLTEYSSAENGFSEASSENHALLGPDDIMQDRIGQVRGGHERLSQRWTSTVSPASRGFRLDPLLSSAGGSAGRVQPPHARPRLP